MYNFWDKQIFTKYTIKNRSFNPVSIAYNFRFERKCGVFR